MTITSKTDIANLSMDILSAGVVIDIHAPSRPDEELLARWYDICRQSTLRSHPWHFAKKRATLAASSTEPVFGYDQCFPLPADFLRLCSVHNSDGEIIPVTEYALEENKILINEEDGIIYILYIYDVENVSLFDPMFKKLLSYDIALNIAFKLTESNTNVDRIAQIRKVHESISKAISGQERPPTRIERSGTLTARRNIRSDYSHRISFE